MKAGGVSKYQSHDLSAFYAGPRNSLVWVRAVDLATLRSFQVASISG